jgi:hypothetical protein
MVQSEGTFLRQYQRKGYAARVHVVVAETIGASNVTVQLDECGDPQALSQGNIEAAYAPAYNDWIQGAVIGAAYALARVKTAAYTATITAIFGMTTDTNPTIVAAATVFAVWNAVNYVPSTEETEFLERKVLKSWDLPFDALPALET